MKFQKDNTKIALTKEMKDQVVKERRERVVREKKEAEIREKFEKEVWRLKDEYQKVTHHLASRQVSYLPVALA